jgi:hypothetical protein
MLIFTTFQQQKKRSPAASVFLAGSSSGATSPSIWRRKPTCFVCGRKNALMGSKSEISVKFSSCSDIKNRLDGNYIYGDGSKPWYLVKPKS